MSHTCSTSWVLSCKPSGKNVCKKYFTSCPSDHTAALRSLSFWRRCRSGPSERSAISHNETLWAHWILSDSALMRYRCLLLVQMQTSVQKAQTTVTSTPSARTRPTLTTASASRATLEMGSSVRVSSCRLMLPGAHWQTGQCHSCSKVLRNTPVLLNLEVTSA